MERYNFEQIAREFHEAYELLAPKYGYETREDTRRFNPDSSNGKLMIAVCQKVLSSYLDKSYLQAFDDIETWLRKSASCFDAYEYDPTRGVTMAIFGKDILDYLAKMRGNKMNKKDG